MDTTTVTILDGSVGHLLKQRNVQTSAAGTQWADSFVVPAVANVELPDAVQQVRILLPPSLPERVHADSSAHVDAQCASREAVSRLLHLRPRINRCTRTTSPPART